MKRSQDQRILGTPNYMAPEVVQGQQHSFSLDYWSLGVIAYELIVGAFPFYGENVSELFDHIVKGGVEYPEVDEEDWTSATDDFVRRLLDPNPKTRLGAESIEEIKNHPFFQGIDWSPNSRLVPPYLPCMSPKHEKTAEGNSELTWSSYLKGGKRKSGGKKKSTRSSGLEPVKEEVAGLKDWDSQNFKYLKLLNRKEALRKMASYKKRHAALRITK